MRTLAVQILRHLHLATHPIPPSQLARLLEQPEHQLLDEIRYLQNAGMNLINIPHFGLQIHPTPDLLLEEDIHARRKTSPLQLGSSLLLLLQTTSTNDQIRQAGLEGRPEGLTCFAESQTQGRGRQGRPWVSPPNKGLWFSLLLRPNLKPSQYSFLTMGAALALIQTFEHLYSLQPKIKWPNDILLDGKKIAGILTEVHWMSRNQPFVVLGIGVNANLEIQDFPEPLQPIATSLKSQLGHPVHRGELAATLLDQLQILYQEIESGHLDQVRLAWENKSSTLGKHVHLQNGDHLLSGIAEALDEHGGLLIRNAQGNLERCIGGEILFHHE